MSSLSLTDMEIVVRPGTAEDAAALAQLATLTFPLACPPHHTPENISAHINRVLSEEKFREYASGEDFALLVADMQGMLVGYALVDFREPDDPDVEVYLAEQYPVAELSKLYVHPEFHGVGIAHTLLDQALLRVAERSITTVWLTVNQLNARANAFYEKSGFANIANKTYRVGDVIDDDYLRVRSLI